MIKEDKEKELLEYLEEIKGFTVIVEGVKDKKVLESIGFRHIIMLNPKGLAECVNGIEEEEVVVLTDFDKKGEELAKKLELFLRKPRRDIRKKLRKLFTKSGISTIEGLKKMIKRWL